MWQYVRGGATRSPRMRKGQMALGMVLVVLWLVLRQFSTALPSGAYPVLSTEKWVGRQPGQPVLGHVVWLANGDLAYLETNARGQRQVCYQQMNEKGPVGPVRFGPELPSDLLAGSFIPSPDEKQIAYAQISAQNQYQTFLISIDGKTTLTLPDYFYGWLSDSSTFLTVNFQLPSVLTIHHLGSVQTETIPSLSPSEMFAPPNSSLSSSNFIVSAPITQTSAAVSPSVPKQLTLRSFSVAHPNTLVEKWQTAVPPGVDFASATASPDNKHLLWFTYSINRKGPPALQWLHSLIPSWKVVPTARRAFFLSDLRGNGMHPVLQNGLEGTHITSAFWTPDSRHLSFISGGKLYFWPID